MSHREKESTESFQNKVLLVMEVPPVRRVTEIVSQFY